MTTRYPDGVTGCCRQQPPRLRGAPLFSDPRRLRVKGGPDGLEIRLLLYPRDRTSPASPTMPVACPRKRAAGSEPLRRGRRPTPAIVANGGACRADRAT